MGVDAMRITVGIKRILVISIRKCYKSVCTHPFLVGFLCFLIILYRSFPFLFSLLVSASPILVCTAILLGTLLSFGETNVPEIEKEKEEKVEKVEEEEEVTCEISSLRAGATRDATVVVEKDENFSVENFVGKKKDTFEEIIGKKSLEENGVSKIEGDGDLGGYVPLIDENSREIQFEKQVIDVAERDFDYLELEKKIEIHEEKQGIDEVFTDVPAAESHFSLLPNGGSENLQVEDDKSLGVSVEADHLDPRHSSWKRTSNDNEEEDEDEDVSDSGSDGAESSSPDASMADIIPMLDELHPLLDEEASQPAHMLHDRPDAASEGYHKSKEGSVESDEDIENLADVEEDGDDDNDNEEEEEEAREDKEDESKSAIKWTEDDQKNLMDLGTSELERNLRLESLIARRRARKGMRPITEKNLIDLDGADLPPNIPAISTARQNPFDLPFNDFDDVPGSAPSILLPRHNPFDLPYDSNEEKLDLKGDSFQEEFSTFQHKEPFFRRHESFNVGPSVLGVFKQERQDLRWKPYFVPERFATEETSYRTFHRQLSEASESKLSSVPDTESVSSVVEDEDKKLNEEDDSQETELVSSVDHASVVVQRGSLSSEDIDSLDIGNDEERDAHHEGPEITLGDLQDHQELDSSLSTSGGATPIDPNTSEILLRVEPGEEECSSRSSLSSSSEVDAKIPDVKGPLDPEHSNGQTEESHISPQTSLDVDFHFMTEMADENQQTELILEPKANPSAESEVLMKTSSDSDFHFTTGAEDGNRCMEPVLEPTGAYIGDSGTLQASRDSDSHFMGEMVDNDGHKDPDVEPRGNDDNELGISTQTSVNSDFHFTSGLMDDNQHKEPVYDSSPQAADKLLFFLSISSDTQEETSEMDSLPTLAKVAVNESEVHTESTEKDASGYKESHQGFSQVHLQDKHGSGSKEFTEIEHDVMKVRLTGDDLTFDGQNGIMERGLGVEHDAVNLLPSSSSNGLVKEGLVHNEKCFSDELDQLHSSSLNAEGIVVPHKDMIEKLDSASSNNQVASPEAILHALEEKQPSVTVDVSVTSKLSFTESASLEEHAIGTEGVLDLDQHQIPSSSFDAEIHVSSCQAISEKLDSAASGIEQMPSDDLKLYANEELQPAVVAEQVLEANSYTSSSGIKDVEGLSSRKEENPMHSSSSDAIVAADLLEEVDVKLVSSGSSYQHVSSEATSSFESEKQLSWSDKAVVEPSLKDHDGFQETSIAAAEVSVENNVDVPEDFNHERSESTSVPLESLECKSKADEVDFKDNILDKIVYEDSGLFLERPTYSLEEHRSSEENTNDDEDEIKEIDEGLLSELDAVGDFWIKEIEGDSLPGEQIKSRDYAVLSRDSSVADIKSELPVLEVRSVADIDLAFRQLHEGVDVKEVILPSMLEDQHADDELRASEEINSDSRAVESLEDVHFAMQQISEGNTEELSQHSNLRGGPEETNEVGASSSTRELPVLEIRTINDIDLVFKQLNEGVDVEEVILPSTIEHVVENESKDNHQYRSDLLVVEASSLQDLHIAMKQSSDENLEEMSKPSVLEAGSAEINEVGSSSSHTELPVEVKTLDDIDLAFKQLNEGADVEEVILPSTLEQNESRDPQKSSSDLQVLEARSLEELHVAMKQVSIEEPPSSSAPIKEDMSRASELNEMSPASYVESMSEEAAEVNFIQKSGSSAEESGNQGAHIEAPQLSKDGVDETSGVSNLTDTKDEEEK